MIGTKQNAAKEAPIVNHMKSPDFGWLNVDGYELFNYKYQFLYFLNESYLKLE